MRNLTFLLAVGIAISESMLAQSGIQLDEIKDFELYEGCYCTYGFSKERYNAGKIIAITQGPEARFSINGKINNLKNGDWDTFYKMYDNDTTIYPYDFFWMNTNYEATIKSKKLFDDENREIRIATLYIRNKKTGISRSVNLYGACFCE